MLYMAMLTVVSYGGYWCVYWCIYLCLYMSLFIYRCCFKSTYVIVFIDVSNVEHRYFYGCVY